MAYMMAYIWSVMDIIIIIFFFFFCNTLYKDFQKG